MSTVFELYFRGTHGAADVFPKRHFVDPTWKHRSVGAISRRPGPQAFGLTAEKKTDEARWSALMAAAQSGDETAYRQLLKELAEVIRHFLLSRFGHSEFVDDCVQETLISIHQARHTWDPARPFRAWLFAIVRNKSIDMFRQRRTRARALEHYQRDQEILAQAGSEGRVQYEISSGRLLESLPEPQREALVLTKFIGYSGAEAAQRLGISEGAVKLRVHRAVRSLRRMLAKEGSG